MSEVILIKPGSTDYDEQGRIQGTLDIPLNHQGADEVEQLAESLDSHKIDILYSPTCEPALETAQALAKVLGVKLKKMAKLSNVNLGLWQGMKAEEVRHKQQRVYRQWQEHPETVCPPDGETLETARIRMKSILTKTIKRHREGTIGLVIPEPMASLVRQFLLGSDTELGDLWAAAADRPTCEFFKVAVTSVESGSEKETLNPLRRVGKDRKSNGLLLRPVPVATE